MAKTVRLDPGTGRINGADEINEFQQDPSGELRLDRRRNPEKRELYTVIAQLKHDAPSVTPAMIRELFEGTLSDTAIVEILTDMGLYEKRATLEELRPNWSPELLERVGLLTQTRRRARKREGA